LRDGGLAIDAQGRVEAQLGSWASICGEPGVQLSTAQRRGAMLTSYLRSQDGAAHPTALRDCLRNGTGLGVERSAHNAPLPPSRAVVAYSDTGWTDREAAVACRQLGFTSGRATWSNFFDAAAGPPVTSGGWDCAGTEASLTECSSPSMFQMDCGSGTAAGVVCFYDWQGARLAGGPSAAQGRLEVQGPDGTWAGVCGEPRDPREPSMRVQLRC
jgi:hypothetical protein